MHLKCDPWSPITIWKLVINKYINIYIYLALPSLLDENVHVNELHGALVDRSASWEVLQEPVRKSAWS